MRDIINKLKQIEESHTEPSGPQVGDEFGISFSEDLEISTTITDVLEDGIVVEMDDDAISHMTENGVKFYEGEIVEEEFDDELEEGKKRKGPCWKNYKQIGMKMKGGKEVPNCVPESIEEAGFPGDPQNRDGLKPWLRLSQLMDQEITKIDLKSDEGIELANSLGAVTNMIQKEDNKLLDALSKTGEPKAGSKVVTQLVDVVKKELNKDESVPVKSDSEDMIKFINATIDKFNAGAEFDRTKIKDPNPEPEMEKEDSELGRIRELAGMRSEEQAKPKAKNTAEEVADALTKKGVKYSVEKQDEIIGMIGDELKAMGMDEKQIRYLLNYDEDFVNDTLSALGSENESIATEGHGPEIDSFLKKVAAMPASQEKMDMAEKAYRGEFGPKIEKAIQDMYAVAKDNQSNDMDDIMDGVLDMIDKKYGSRKQDMSDDISSLANAVMDEGASDSVNMAKLKQAVGGEEALVTTLHASAVQRGLDDDDFVDAAKRMLNMSSEEVQAIIDKNIKGEESITSEAEYQGRKVSLGKPTRGDVKKFKVYVKNPKGNVVKVNFGDPNMKIKKSNPARRKSFRARHNCANPGPRHKARYWSCRKW